MFEECRYYKYFRPVDGATLYFYTQELLKNGNWRGLRVIHGFQKKPQKAKTDIVDKLNFSCWKLIETQTIDPAVISRIAERQPTK